MKSNMLSIAKEKKKVVLTVIWSIVGIAWLIMGSVFLLADSQTTSLVALTTAAVVTEVAFWLTALLLGMALADARKALWGKITGKFTGQSPDKANTPS